MEFPITQGSNPESGTLTKDVWTLVAKGVLFATITNQYNADQKVYYTYVNTNDPAPEGLDVPFWKIKNDETFFNGGSILRDLYLYAVDYDASVILEDRQNIGLQKEIDTNAQNQVSSPLDWFLSRKLGSTNLTNNIPITDEGSFFAVTETYTFALDDVSAINIADPKGHPWIELWEGPFFYQAEIIALSGNDVTVSMPVGLPFTTNATVLIVDIEQNRNFSLIGTDPIGEQWYTVEPGEAFTGDFHELRLFITMLHSTASDSSTYGNIQGGLLKGIVFSGRGTIFDYESGLPKDLVVWNSLFNIKRNLDWKSTSYDVTYDPKSGNPSSPTYYGTSIRKSFNGDDKSGVVIPVRKDRLEITRALLRDNMGTLINHRMKTTGHLTV